MFLALFYMKKSFKNKVFAIEKNQMYDIMHEL